MKSERPQTADRLLGKTKNNLQVDASNAWMRWMITEKKLG